MKHAFILGPTVDALIAEAHAGGALAVPVTERHGEVDEVLVYRDGGVIASVLKTAPRGLAVWLGWGAPLVAAGDAKAAVKVALGGKVLEPPPTRLLGSPHTASKGRPGPKATPTARRPVDRS